MFACTAAKAGRIGNIGKIGRIGEELSAFNKAGNLGRETLQVGSSFGNEEAKLSSNALRLSKQLASEAQMAGEGTIIIENDALRSAGRLSQQYGGSPSEWVKKSSTSFSKGGTIFETHWYENTLTRARVEFKTKISKH